MGKNRREESAKLAAKGDGTLKRTHCLWLHETVSEKGRERFEELLEINLKTSKAWLFNEQSMEFWHQSATQPAAGFFELWRRSIMRCPIPAMRKAAATLKAQLSGLLSSFRHRMTNEASTPRYDR